MNKGCTCDTPTGSESRNCDYCRNFSTYIKKPKKEKHAMYVYYNAITNEILVSSFQLPQCALFSSETYLGKL